MNRVDPNVAHGPAGASRGSVAKSPSASGLSHGLKGRGNGRAPETASSETRGQDNPERIRDQRLEQADHLRQVGERNGNERLNTTADRMQANAQKQYVRQAGNVAPVDGTTNVPPAANLGDSKGQTAPTSSRTPAASTPATSGRPSWLPTWLRGPGAK
jgi:hypothetical protein